MLADELRLTYRQAHGIAPAPVESAKSNPFEATFSTKVYTGTRRGNTATIRLTQLCVVSLCCPNLNPNHCRPCNANCNANQRRRRCSSSRCVLSTAHLNCAFTLQLYYSNKSFVIFCDVCSATPPFHRLRPLPSIENIWRPNNCRHCWRHNVGRLCLERGLDRRSDKRRPWGCRSTICLTGF